MPNQVVSTPEAVPVEVPTPSEPQAPTEQVTPQSTPEPSTFADPTPSVPRQVPTLAETPPPPVEPVRVGGNIIAPKKTKDVRPLYPPVAQSARVTGVVILEAVIGPDGSVTDVKVLRSVPLLDPAAIEAVRQWEYTPTLMNGVPVSVIMTVTVNFQLR